jgi:two-component system, NtrC family, response regulator AtoC
LTSDESKTLSVSEVHHDEQPLALIVLGEGAVETYPMPRPGRVRIGRAETNEVRIDHSLISREHAVFIVGERIELQDLGSRNGTFVRDRRLAENERRVVEAGQLIQFGSTLCIIQRSKSGPPQRRIATHAALEHRLDELCRGSARGAQHSLLRIHVGDGVSPARVQRILVGAIGPQDLAASYAPGEYEVLLVDSSDREERIRIRLERELADDRSVRIGGATFPHDGTTADELIQRACAAVLEHEQPKDDAPVVIDGAMKDLYAVARRVAVGNISVLLLGETGVGKEMLAEAIHRASPRSDRPFVRLNCAALSESLLESELFGYEKGAFTGAQTSKMGLLESASGGTIMLDELGEIPLPTQAKLLRVLEQRQVLPVGGLEPRPIDVRFVSATNRDLEAEVARGSFRQDVFFRLNGVTLMIPPLRERTMEIEALAQRFIARAAADLGVDPPSISPRAMELILDYDWPGNIRELKNTMERAVLLSTEETIEPEHLPHEKMSIPASFGAPSSGSNDDDRERQRILDALDQCAGNQTRAAKLLGIGRRTLTSKLTRYGIRRPRKKGE